MFEASAENTITPTYRPMMSKLNIFVEAEAFEYPCSESARSVAYGERLTSSDTDGQAADLQNNEMSCRRRSWKLSSSHAPSPVSDLSSPRHVERLVIRSRFSTQIVNHSKTR